MRGALTARRTRLAALLALGGFAVHQLRYALAFGSDAGSELAHEGHGYLAVAPPALALFAFAAIAATLLAARSGAAGAPRSAPPGALVCAAALFAIFSSQELLEGTLIAGHPAGLDAIVAGGGWVAVLAALAVGAAVSLVNRALARAERALAALLERPPLGRSPRAAGRPRPALRLTPLRSPLAFGLARRPPPSLV
jgi:hypothetical protein